MKFQVLSDTHIETYPSDTVPLEEIINVDAGADILILAGDIGCLYRPNQLSNFLKSLSPHYQYMIYVPGNNEYYKPKDYVPLHMRELKARLNSLSNDIRNLFILDRATLKIGGITFIGATLWSESRENLPKYFRVYKMSKQIYNSLNLRDIEFIKKSVTDSKGKTIVITHYPPFKLDENTESNLNVKRDREDIYYNNLDGMLNGNITTWIWGHVHSSHDVIINDTRLISNPKGKRNDTNIEYNKNFVFKV